MVIQDRILGGKKVSRSYIKLQEPRSPPASVSLQERAAMNYEAHSPTRWRGWRPRAATGPSPTSRAYVGELHLGYRIVTLGYIYMVLGDNQEAL